MTAERNPGFSARTGWARHLPWLVALAGTGIIAALVIAALIIAAERPAMTGRNIALVIGNSSYRTVPSLPNPAHDAGDMAQSLRRLGFNVTHLSDLDYNGFRRALIGFGAAAKTADKAVIFYAGHGVEMDGKNWLIPVDAEVRSAIDIYAEGVNLETLIDISVLPKSIGLVVLDACRDDPFAAAEDASQRRLDVPIHRSAHEAEERRPASETSRAADAAAGAAGCCESAHRGLAPVEVSDNVMVGFAAAAGTSAADGKGRNSPYSGSLLRHVETPGLEVNYLFRDVHDEVMKETGTQEPAIYGSLSSQAVFLSGGGVDTAAEGSTEAERVAWAYVRSTYEVATLRRFIDQFPSGAHLGLARERIAQIENAENRAWAIAERQNSPAAYRGFLDLYPYSERSEHARVTLASLETKGDAAASEAAVAMPAPPQPPSAARSEEEVASSPQTVERVWEVLRKSRDHAVVERFAARYPSQRAGRVAASSDLALRRANPTDWMLRTAGDQDVDACFRGVEQGCVAAIGRYPDYVQLQFQRCRLRSGNEREECMRNSVDAARSRGLLISAYTRSALEKTRNAAYRVAVARVQDNVSTAVADSVNRAASNAVSGAVSKAAGEAAAAGAGNALALATGGTASAALPVAVKAVAVVQPVPSAATAAASAMAAPSATTAVPSATTAVPSAATAPPSAATAPPSGAASQAGSQVSSQAGSRAASHAASQAGSRAASHAASRSASQAASRAASHSASRAAARAASRAASDAAARAAASAASNATSRIASDRRLKRDIVAVGTTDQGLRLYRYRYVNDNVYYVGVMAQEVAIQVPAAVSQQGGYLEVDYKLLGVEFMTYRQWLRQHRAQDMR